MSYTFATIFLVALLISRALSPFAARLAVSLGAVALPGDRNIHRGVVPRLGGLAMIAGIVCALSLLLVIDNEVGQRFRDHAPALIGLAIGLVLILMLGIYDDMRGASAKIKLPVQALAAGIAYAAGCRIDVLSNPLGGADIDLGWLGLPATLVWFILVVNAINLIDGLDGLATGITAFVAATIFTVASANGHLAAAAAALALCGAAVGFLRYNFPPASIFLGDTGSLSAGYLIAGIAVLGAHKSSTAVALFVPIVVLGVPLFDTVTSFWRRVFRAAHPFRADKEHIHHRILARGVSTQHATLILYGVTLILVALALTVAYFDGIGKLRHVGWTLFATAAFLLAVGGLLGYLNVAEVRMHARSGARNRVLNRARERALLSFRQEEVTSCEALWIALGQHLRELGFQSHCIYREDTGLAVQSPVNEAPLPSEFHHAFALVVGDRRVGVVSAARRSDATGRACDREALADAVAAFCEKYRQCEAARDDAHAVSI